MEAGSLPLSARQSLLTWFDRERRDLPWRRSGDPYAIWVSEIMLQQTQVATVIPYFERWMVRFPTVEALAQADLEEVLAQWQGLGYYRRCRMLHQGAKFVVLSGIPGDAAGWRMVPGVGRYTAGAISSIAFGWPEPLVDGNVVRVFARLSAEETSGKTLESRAWKWAANSIDSARPGDWNQALMELGATLCKPKNPECFRCPLADFCRANALGRPTGFPKVEPKRPTVKLDQRAVIGRHIDARGETRLAVEKIPLGEWWEGMWRFPTLAISEAELEWVGAHSHSVTHHRITLNVYAQLCSRPATHLTWFNADELKAIAMPSPQRRALELHANRSLCLFDADQEA